MNMNSLRDASPSASVSQTWALDFGGPGGRQSFQSLADSSPNLGIVRLAPPAVEDHVLPTAEAYVDHYLTRAPSPQPPRLLLAFCAGGTLAASLMSSLSVTKELSPVSASPLKLLMIDSLPSGGDLVHELRETLARLGWSSERDFGIDVQEAQRDLQRAKTTEQRVEVAERTVRRFVSAWLISKGLGGSDLSGIVDKQSVRCRAWFCYLEASRSVSRDVWLQWAPFARVYASKEMFSLASQRWAQFNVEVQSLDHPAESILASREVLHVVNAAVSV